MRNSVLTPMTLICGTLLGLVSFVAHATIIHVGLAAANGDTSWTSPVIGDPHGTVTLSGWEYDNSTWTPATIYSKTGGGAETGMGLICNESPSHNECGQNEIGASPWQMLDLDISNVTGWSSLTFYLGSVNATNYGSGGGTGGNETGYLLGSKCSRGDANCTETPITLASCTDFGTVTTGSPIGSAQCSFTLSYADLYGINDIWITPSKTNPDGSNNANILFGSYFDLKVPEPAELGIFGFGILLIGLFVGLRRRTTG